MTKAPVILLIIAILSVSCKSSKKAASSSPGTKSASSSAKDNPSFDKPQAELIDPNTFKISEVSSDASYGYTKENPIKVGGQLQGGAANERRYLNALLGPNGQSIKYVRRGSCCMFDTPNGMTGKGLLDAYEVTYEGLDKPIVLYVNMYDYGILRAPKGFTFRTLAEKG